MIKKITALDLRHHLGDVLNRTSLRDDQFIIERKGKPLAVLIPMWQFEKIQDVKKRFINDLAVIHKRTSKFPSPLIEVAIDEAVRSVRSRRLRHL